MLHIVEIRHIGSDLPAAMAELRDWLQQHQIEPVAFEHSAGGPGITFRVHFSERNEAVDFAETFHGWLNNGARPEGTARWTVASPPTPRAEASN